MEHGKGNLAFHAVEVIVQTAVSLQNYRSGNTVQIQGPGQLPLEGVLHKFDGALCLPQVQAGVIMLGKDQGLHQIHLFAVNFGVGQRMLPTVRGYRITSRMLDIPVTYMIIRSKPRPKPECGTLPYLRRSR